MMNSDNQSATIFTTHDIDRFLQQYPEKANSLEEFLLKNEPSSLISNLKTQSIVITKGSQTLFATVNDKEYDNTHLCSPYNIYIGYAKLSAKNFERRWIRFFIYGFTTLFGKAFKSLRINKVIQLNNTFSTINLQPENSVSLFPDIIQKLTQRFPQHAIIWPRINALLDSDLCKLLKANHFHFVPTKIVHIYHENQNYIKRSHTKRDLSLLKKSDYAIARHHDLTPQDLQRIHQLYEMLFIQKHAGYNPQLTLKYFEACHQHRWFEFTALRNKAGDIDAFISQAKLNGIMICGPLGYDIAKPTKLGLYRMIIGASLDNAYQAQCTYNLGSGNELFKLNRGSDRQMEYNAVYYHHLPFYRQIPWKILAWAGQQFSMRVFKKHLL